MAFPVGITGCCRHFALFIILLFASCSKPDPISVPSLVRPPEMSGGWILSEPSGLSIALQLSQSGTVFSGTCTISAGGSSINGGVQGFCTYPNVTFTIFIPGYYDVRFIGKMIGETNVTGVLNGSGFSNFPMSGNRR